MCPGGRGKTGRDPTSCKGWSGLRGYLAEHNDVEADAVGLDERAVLAALVTVVFGKPGEGGRWQSREGMGHGKPGRAMGLALASLSKAGDG